MMITLSRGPDGKLVDISPMHEGKPPIKREASGWVPFKPTFGYLRRCKPLTEKEISELSPDTLNK
jgi:hypothetical protein